MITDEQKKQIESLTTEEMLSEIAHCRLSNTQGDEKYTHLKACYQLRTSEDTNTNHDRYNLPLGKIAIGITVVAPVAWIIYYYLDISL